MQTEHKVHDEVKTHSHKGVPPRSRTASSADWPQCPLPSVSLAMHCTAPVPCAGAKLPPRPVPGRRAETDHSSPGQVGTNAGGKGIITYSGWQTPKQLFLKMKIKTGLIPFSPLFFLVRSIWSLSWILTCLSFGWSLIKGCFRSCSVEGRCM